jgi:hypothetical protein
MKVIHDILIFQGIRKKKRDEKRDKLRKRRNETQNLNIMASENMNANIVACFTPRTFHFGMSIKLIIYEIMKREWKFSIELLISFGHSSFFFFSPLIAFDDIKRSFSYFFHFHKRQ